MIVFSLIERKDVGFDVRGTAPRPGSDSADTSHVSARLSFTGAISNANAKCAFLCCQHGQPRIIP